MEKVIAHDADTGINAEIIYKIEKGAFDDFGIENKTGVVKVISKLDYDRRESYTIYIIAVDGGTSFKFNNFFLKEIVHIA